MKWKKYTIDTTTEAEDFLSAMLDEIGIEGIEIDDNVPLSSEDTTAMFIDFPPELPEDKGLSKVSFYLDAEEDHTEMLQKVKEAIEETRLFVNVGEGTITEFETEDLDWMNNWKEYFHSFTIDDILIKPTWEEVTPENKAKTVIEIDPGSSFGTGKHETTQLCIKELQKYVNKESQVLDVGCGSGILSIVALKLGAKHVIGTDVDPNCMTSTAENFEVNHLGVETGSFYAGDLTSDQDLRDTVGYHKYDVVVANILADIIIPMADALYGTVKEDGILITSGIIDFKEEAVKEALLAAGFEIVSVGHQGEWVSVTARPKKA
jgi:ribosomal protein L11 methyltransferase